MCVVVSCDCFTGVFAGFAVFATIGYLAKQLGESVEKYADASGPGLAFITYPEAISHMPASSLFAILFFLMLLALGLGSQVDEMWISSDEFSHCLFLVCSNGRTNYFNLGIVSGS